ncbi:MAG: hypothetical protein J6B50_01125 [Lachnospiraceae bacterium]|nr:hypothetical protein [Lachnospiraceae bacterium]
MKFNRKKFAASLLALLIIVSLTGCSLFGNSKKTYANYVQSLLDVNYKAEFTDYMNITGTTQEEAQAVYDDGLNYLAEALMVAYGVNDVEGSDIKSQFVELAKNIYSHASYEITEVTKTDGVYQVAVTIYPIDILLITYDDVVAYIEDMNQRVTAGEYNDYELDDYETEYAQGIIDILNEAIPNIGNGEGVTVTVTILDNEEYYYISDADFLALDKAILATTTVNEDGTTGSTEETVSEDTN